VEFLSFLCPFCLCFNLSSGSPFAGVQILFLVAKGKVPPWNDRWCVQNFWKTTATSRLRWLSFGGKKAFPSSLVQSSPNAPSQFLSPNCVNLEEDFSIYRLTLVSEIWIVLAIEESGDLHAVETPVEWRVETPVEAYTLIIARDKSVTQFAHHPTRRQSTVLRSFLLMRRILFSSLPSLDSPCLCFSLDLSPPSP
jgi:hypothetical protein